MSAKYAKKMKSLFCSRFIALSNWQLQIPSRADTKTLLIHQRGKKKLSSNCQIFIFFYESLLFDFFFFMTYMHFLKEILSRHRGLGHMYRAIPLLAR